MARIDIERQNELEPKRIEFAKQQIECLGYTIHFETAKELRFMFKGKEIRVFPYSGWHSGASIVDGRGIGNLLNQIQ